MMNFTDWAKAHQVRFEAVLEGLLPSPDLAPQRLHQATATGTTPAVEHYTLVAAT